MLVNGRPAQFCGLSIAQIGPERQTVAILGMACKGDSDDKRESLSYKLRKLSPWNRKEVLCTDPYVEDAKPGSLEEAVRRADIVIFGPRTPLPGAAGSPGQTGRGCLGFWADKRKPRSPRVSLYEILVTGSAGFICGYLVPGTSGGRTRSRRSDNFSKYGPPKNRMTPALATLFEGDGQKHRTARKTDRDATISSLRRP